MQKKTLMLMLVLFTAVISTKAQEVVSSSGNYQETSNGSLSWTIGEPITETKSNGNTLTQGFQQSRLTVTNISEIKPADISVSIFPNPTNEFITIKVSEAQDYTVQLFNLNGQLLTEQKSNNTEERIDMMPYTNGTYLLKFINNNETNTYQIIKQ